MNAGDVALQKKKATPLIKWAKAVVEGAGVLDMASEFLGQLDALRAQRVIMEADLGHLKERGAAAANEFHAQAKRHADARDQFAPEMAKIRDEVGAQRGTAAAEIEVLRHQVVQAEEKHAVALSVLAEEMLEMEGLLEATVDKYNAFMKEITPHG